MQIIPIIGGLVGAAINGNFIRDLGYGAIRSYQERWLTDNDKWRDIEAWAVPAPFSISCKMSPVRRPMEGEVLLR